MKLKTDYKWSEGNGRELPVENTGSTMPSQDKSQTAPLLIEQERYGPKHQTKFRRKNFSNALPNMLTKLNGPFLQIICSFLLIMASACQPKEEIAFPVGGLNYPRHVTGQDSSFYIYQYKDSLDVLDSLRTADYGRYFLRGFDEANLSIAPQSETVFRFIYEVWVSQPVVIKLTQNKLIVKQGLGGWLYPDFNIDRLNEDDQAQLNRSEWYFRIGYEKIKLPLWLSYFDSLLRRYPNLQDINNYAALRQKAIVYQHEKYRYSTAVIAISKTQYNSIVEKISASGFWSMRRESNCKNVPTDAGGFSLEANTANHYKIVSSASCPDDTRKFTIVCQEIVNLAGLGQKIRLIWDGSASTGDTIQIPEVPLEEGTQVP